MSSRSFSKKTCDVNVIKDALAYHVRHIAAELRSMGAYAGTLRVSLQTSRHGDFFLRGGSDVVMLPVPSSDTFVLLNQAQILLNNLFEPDTPYQKVGVTVGNIVPEGIQTASLFVTGVDSNKSLMQAVDHLNSKGNGELIVFGSRFKTKDWQTKAVARSGSYTTQWSDILKVSAK